MDEIRFMLPMPPSINALYSTNWKTKRRFTSKRYGEWKNEAVAHLMQQRVPRLQLAERTPITINLGRPDRRIRDAANYEKAIGDMLKAYGVVADDRYLYPCLLDWTDDHPGQVEITIRPFARSS